MATPLGATWKIREAGSPGTGHLHSHTKSGTSCQMLMKCLNGKLKCCVSPLCFLSSLEQAPSTATSPRNQRSEAEPGTSARARGGLDSKGKLESTEHHRGMQGMPGRRSQCSLRVLWAGASTQMCSAAQWSNVWQRSEAQSGTLRLILNGQSYLPGLLKRDLPPTKLSSLGSQNPNERTQGKPRPPLGSGRSLVGKYFEIGERSLHL